VPPNYDSLIAKLIVHAETRQSAIERGRRALAEFVLTGPSTTIPFHRAILDEPDFGTGRISTGFIPDHPALIAHTRTLAAQRSPLEPLYGGAEIAAAIAVGLTEGAAPD
jgi:acetyl/propionyl-CoA carboxylase alpha subunit